MITVNIQKRFGDFDMYGHINSVAYFAYIEVARVIALEKLFKTQADKAWFLVAKQSCDYFKPILLNDEVFIDLKVLKIGKSSFDIEYLLKNKDKIFAKAYTTLVQIDKITKKALPLSDDIKSILSQLL